MTYNYDIIIFGGGIAGLFAASRLQRAGYNLVLFEKDRIGGIQTLASQGMIHGGQKYTLQGRLTAHAVNVAAMPERWEACFRGDGEIDLSGVKFMNDTQLMFPAGSFLSNLTVFAAAKTVNGATRKIARDKLPEALRQRKKFFGATYEMQEKVVDVKSLVSELAKNLRGRILRGEPQEITPDGQVVVAGIPLRARAIVFTAGTGNETALGLLRAGGQHTQRRPLRQIMVKPLPYALYGHGIAGQPKPRVTVTSYPLGNGEYVWYLGGNVAEKSATLSEAEAIQFAKKEMQDIFPQMDWAQKEWASWLGDRAEPYDAKTQLPPGPHIHQRGKILMAWPTKLTLVPALSDNIFDWVQQSGITPSPQTAAPSLPAPETGFYPWEEAAWQRL